ncbi:ribonuclease H-like domain-containing protein [Anaerosolibacter sp.]|uniref:ribonuclease H-like domain-containing protein n=1 Tax=Anaerosolibacter sp. TaxID=1872527 RepID=UPI0039F1364F
MEIINYFIQERLPLPDNFLSVFKDLSFVVFDIETTGLSPEYHQVILAGILYVQGEHIVIEQFFCHHRREEKVLLEAFHARIKAFDILISYNGDSFDIPFLNKRFRKHRIRAEIDPRKSFDILKFVRRKKDLLKLQDCKLKSVEQSLNIVRTDTISGKESVELYQAYEISPSETLKKKILLHNYDDLYYFSKCLSILDKVDFNEFLASAPFLIHIKEDQLCHIDKRLIKGTTLTCFGFYPSTNSVNDHLRYELGYKFAYHHRDHTFELQIPMSKGTLSSGESCLYVNTNDFPISYERHNRDLNIPNHLIALKIGKEEQNIEIVGFLSTLLKHLFSEV